MRQKAELVMVDGEYTFLLEDGTTIEKDMVGWVANGFDNYSFFDKFSINDALFILDNNIECEVEMTDEFTNPEEYSGVPLFEGGRKPKTYKGKVIFYLK